ncbi:MULTISPECIES: hypothetical protein [unclassified Streptomyces]|uniref:hypothetical protein n=1 Tax=unclassified Streptomyces TaxID=2593676 RepID=UPI000823EB0F|nr:MULTISPECIES: hypothetical protein [unclassified Streptomyces]SCK18148.1 hypothetical protein YW7DRAFT_01240 [Streptomyces sp. AmelKG-E11A]
MDGVAAKYLGHLFTVRDPNSDRDGSSNRHGSSDRDGSSNRHGSSDRDGNSDRNGKPARGPERRPEPNSRICQTH